MNIVVFGSRSLGLALAAAAALSVAACVVDAEEAFLKDAVVVVSDASVALTAEQALPLPSNVQAVIAKYGVLVVSDLSSIEAAASGNLTNAEAPITSGSAEALAELAALFPNDANLQKAVVQAEGLLNTLTASSGLPVLEQAFSATSVAVFDLESDLTTSQGLSFSHYAVAGSSVDVAGRIADGRLHLSHLHGG